jgi:hypothetical protein
MKVVKNTVFLNVVDEWLTLLLRIREVPGSSSVRGPAFLSEGFRGFPSSRQMPGYYLKIRTRTFLFTFFPIQHSPIILSFDTI